MMLWNKKESRRRRRKIEMVLWNGEEEEGAQLLPRHPWEQTFTLLWTTMPSYQEISSLEYSIKIWILLSDLKPEYPYTVDCKLSFVHFGFVDLSEKRVNALPWNPLQRKSDMGSMNCFSLVKELVFLLVTLIQRSESLLHRSNAGIYQIESLLYLLFHSSDNCNCIYWYFHLCTSHTKYLRVDILCNFNVQWCVNFNVTTSNTCWLSAKWVSNLDMDTKNVHKR